MWKKVAGLLSDKRNKWVDKAIINIKLRNIIVRMVFDLLKNLFIGDEGRLKCVNFR